MRKLAFTLSAAALTIAGAAFAQPAPGEHHMPMGDMTRAQALQHAEQMFDRMDANHDGTLNEADRAAREGMMFDKIDTDHNGSISRQEFDAFHAGMAKRMGEHMGKMGEHRMGGRMMGGDHAMSATKAQFTARALAMFDKADADHNGTVTVAERQAAMQAMRGQWQARKAAAAPQG